jgi:hypothetical protein
MARYLAKTLLCATGFIVSSYSNYVYAQSTVMFENFLPSVVETNLRNQVLWEPYRNNSDSKTVVTRNQNSTRLAFKIVPAQRKRNLSNFVSKVRASDPAGADQLAQMFATTDVIDLVGKAMSGMGLRPDNLADAYAVYWSSAWHASVGSNDTPSREQFGKMKSQAAAALAATPEVANASNAVKQEFAESLLIQAALIDASLEQAQNDPAMLKAIANAVRQGASAMGLDLRSMTLTEDGFVPSKRKTGSLEDDDVQLASARENQGAAVYPNYALIAAAGGVGLGGMFLLGKAMGRKN